MLIFPPIPMPAWLFVTLYGLVELYLGLSNREVGVAHFAHLGGMVGGFALILYWRSQRLSGTERAAARQPPLTTWLRPPFFALYIAPSARSKASAAVSRSRSIR